MGDRPFRLLVHKGKYPLYDVQVRIADLDKFDELGKSGSTSYDDYMKAIEVLKIDNLSPGQAHVLGRWNLKDAGNIKKYNVFIEARNVSIIQNIVLKK